MMRDSVSSRAIRLIDSIAEADALTPEWRDLLARSEHRAPAKAPVWALSWWRVFGTSGRKLRIVTVRDGGTLVGLAPLVHHATIERGVPIRRLELLGTGEDEADEICSDYGGIIAARGYEERVASALTDTLTDLGDWDELALVSMSADDPAVSTLAKTLGTTIEPAGACPYIALPKTWDEYLRSLESANRYLVVRTLRDLDKYAKGDVKLVRADATSLHEGQRLLRALHGERWSARSLFESARFAQFHDLVMPKLLASTQDGGLDLTWLMAGGRPIAITYSVTSEGRIQFYQSGRALDVPKGIRPGIALHALAIRRAIEEGMREYDFLAGDAHYKKQLATHSRGLVSLRAIAPSTRARLVATAREGIGRAAALLRARRARHAEAR